MSRPSAPLSARRILSGAEGRGVKKPDWTVIPSPLQMLSSNCSITTLLQVASGCVNL